jgi:nucleotide-binding universal stress UspA family protein
MSQAVKLRVTEEGMTMQIRRILAPTDFSDPSKQAVAYAFELAQHFGATLILLHAIEIPAYASEGFIPPSLGTTLMDDIERQAYADLAQLLPEAQDAKVDVARCVVVGMPSQAIIESAEAEKADLIVMATHGRTGFKHLILGSVAERVVRTASCPVLTIRPTASAVEHGEIRASSVN